jgi:hypothetical protein
MRTGRIISIAVLCIVAMAVVPFTVFGADKLLVKDGSSNTQFVVTDAGLAGFGNPTPAEFVDIQGNGVSTNIKLTRYGANPGAIFRAANGTLSAPTQVLANGTLGGFVAAGYTNAGAFSGNKVGITFAASENFTSTAQGTNLQIYTTTTGTLTKALKARFDDSGMGLQGAVYSLSSRASKDNIEKLSADKAIEAVRNLEPVTYTYKFDKEHPHVGFIAEDVPQLVATKERKSLVYSDIVAVLTKVVQEQDKTIESLSEKLSKLEAKLNKLESKDMSAQK